MHKLLFLVFSLPLVVNFCGDDKYFEAFEYEFFTGKVSGGKYFSQTDTIWIIAEASAYTIGEDSGDSVLIDDPMFFRDPSFTLVRLIPPTSGVNSEWAIDEFEIIVKAGEIEFPECRSSFITYYAGFDEEEKRFFINIGLIPKRVGKYLISMNNINFTNEVQINELFNDYILVDNPQRVEWVRCERTNRINMKNPEGKHFFRVR